MIWGGNTLKAKGEKYQNVPFAFLLAGLLITYYLTIFKNSS